MTRSLVLCIVVILTSCGRNHDSVGALGTLEVDRIQLVADSNEPIVDVLVVEGDEVKVGQILVRQDPSRINASLKRVKADLDGARARLAEAEAGPRAQNINAARAQLSAAESEMKTARIALDREKSLIKQSYASQNNVDILEGRHRTAEARKEEAEATLAQLLEGTRSEVIDAARSQFVMAQAQLEEIEISLARTSLTAPVAGKVETVIYEIGERPQIGSALVVVLRNQKPYARVHVPEPLRSRLKPGMPAEIHIDGYDSPQPGRLRWISHDASFTPFFALTQRDRSHLSYLAEVELTGDTAATIATGVPVEVYFPGLADE